MVSIWELSTVLRNLPQSWECMSLACHRLLGVSSYSIRIHIKVAIIHHFFCPHLQLWMETDDREIAPCLTNDRMASLHGLPTGKLLLLKERTWTNRLPLLQLPSVLISQRDCSQLHRRRMEKHWLVWGHTMMGVKGKMTYNSNQPSALMCYFTKVGLHQTGEVCS